MCDLTFKEYLREELDDLAREDDYTGYEEELRSGPVPNEPEEIE